MPVLTAHTVNGTIIVPAGEPFAFTAEQLDKIGEGVWVLSFPAVVGGIILLFQCSAPYNRWWSYSRLSTLWMWSVALVSVGIFSRYGEFDHFLNFAAIAHVQVEWLIISLLLAWTPLQGYLASSAVGLFLYLLTTALPGIKGSFFGVTVVGGFGDVFMPLILLHGRQWLLGIGGIGHFVNAYITFRAFVQYTSPSLYISLQLISTTIYSVATVAGVWSAPAPNSGPIKLGDNGPVPSDHHVKQSTMVAPSQAAAVRLAVIALVVDLVFALPINLTPR